MRTVILHYHLFKNAGTSVDKILKDNFGDRWVTREFAGFNNTVQVMDWIKANPDAVAFSSHTMMGPLPKIAGVRIIGLVFLRDPLARILSAYRFEQHQQSENFGAVLAKATNLEGYARVRLALPQDRQCRNFQTWRLASLVPGADSELERAKQALSQLGVVGLVADFNAGIARLKAALATAYPEFRTNAETHMNASGSDGSKALASAEVLKLLQDVNSDDMVLIRLAEQGGRDAE